MFRLDKNVEIVKVRNNKLVYYSSRRYPLDLFRQQVLSNWIRMAKRALRRNDRRTTEVCHPPLAGESVQPDCLAISKELPQNLTTKTSKLMLTARRSSCSRLT